MTTKIEVSDSIASVAGFQVAGIDAGLRKQPAPDLALIVMEAAGAAAGVFTSNKVQAAPVILDRALLADHPERIRAVLINAACANACTGEPGMENARSTQKWVAEMLGCQADEVLVMSTGVIGVQLPIEKMRAGIPVAAQSLSATNWAVAARAIMTTDTKPKSASVIADGYSIAGIAKGAGMIAPNMATLLSTVVTDAVIAPALLQKALLEAVEVSFNRVVIDGDMSTNDTLLALASGRSGTAINESNYPQFVASLTAVCENLARKIVADGEGVTRFITIHVKNAATSADARLIANTIATSPLVKTAFYGGDANWGRILAAAGRSGVDIDQWKASLWYDELQLVSNGLPLNYDDARANALAAQPEVTVTLDVNMGSADAIVWTCDLSHDYVSINGHYRT
ncbi:MAG: bifunctional glutamate N-acetyltransferase/amino-acid acetyltransferase ArgJ [Anaerolineae bacterium]|nr:bifunctional glutamate N-acetyltransferase/amino-acid acetyltransferase ArgJ [Anaerolineae bacterium]